MNRKIISVAVLAVAAVAVGCSTLPAGGDYDALAAQMVRSAFRSEGIARVERATETDDTQKLCSAADVAGQPLDPAVARRIEQANLKTVKWPSDGKFLGDWKQGEQIAQSGRGGLTWTDDAKTINGGNCYNCHQIAASEISFGTIGPNHYGKLRGVKDPNSAEARPVVEYTWGKIWNAKAYNACSNMPRSGHMGNLSEQQIRHIMALLLDPASPVNR